MRQFEFIAFDTDATEFMATIANGAVAGLVVLHHAPSRWLLILSENADPAMLDALRRGEAGVLVEVSGKYQAVRFEGEAGRRTLAATVNLDAILPAGRDCAAVMLFDAPAILARLPAGFMAWVSTSHVRDLTAAADRAGRICEKMTG